MTHRFRKQFVLFAASTAVVAGGVLVPTTAFAATPTAPHTVVADAGDAGDPNDGSKSNLLLIVPADSEGSIKVTPHEDRPAKDRPGKGGKKHPGKGGSSDDRIVVKPGKHEWQCITAPCGPPEELDKANRNQPALVEEPDKANRNQPALVEEPDKANQPALVEESEVQRGDVAPT
ncbi:hypothetical protein [Streptomyces sp. NPDC088762]|uniref:hypothetical protein n=1 Tax=Streptomyces sp. NPDC088762 TaxID=3365891 RepID=UPI0038260D10